MKKLVLICIFCLTLFAFSGCDDTTSIIQNNMSDLRINYYEGKNDVIYANLSCGFREEIFSYDGVSTNPIECGVLTIGYFNTCSYASIMAVLIVDGTETEYVLEKSPYEDVFVVDIEKILTHDSVDIKLKNQSKIITLNCVSKDWKIDYKTAISIAAKNLKQQINNLYFNGKLNAECYLKVVSKIDYENKYWYFSIVDIANNNYHLLIDVLTGKIVVN